MKTDLIDIEEKTVGKLVADDYRKAEVFKRFGIDFCCGGGRTVKKACEKKGLNLDDLKQELAKVQQRDLSSAGMKFNEWDPAFLVDYILNVHHAYIRENAPLLMEFTTKVARVHGDAHPEVVKIAELFKGLVAELEQHMMKEEKILFPYIKQLAKSLHDKEKLGSPPFGTVENPVRMMELEHEHAGDAMAEIRKLSGNFTPPEHACTTYRVSFFKLEEFESDLHTHIHLENNILFPKAINIEQTLSSSLKN